jgi:hypothetical protein
MPIIFGQARTLAKMNGMGTHMFAFKEVQKQALVAYEIRGANVDIKLFKTPQVTDPIALYYA